MRRLLKRPAALLGGALLASLLVVLIAAPAGAQTVTHVSHHKKHLWHYWLAPVLLGSGVLIVFALSFGYYWRVVRGR